MKENETINKDMLLKRVWMFLEDGECGTAVKYCQRVLDIEPENSDAYIGLLMAEFRVKKFEELQTCQIPLDCSKNYKKIISFSDNEVKEKLEAYNKNILVNIKENKRHQIYMKAVQKMNNSRSGQDYAEVIKMFEPIQDYRDVKQLMEQCEEKKKILQEENEATSNKLAIACGVVFIILLIMGMLNSA